LERVQDSRLEEVGDAVVVVIVVGTRIV